MRKGQLAHLCKGLMSVSALAQPSSTGTVHCLAAAATSSLDSE